MVSPTLRLGLRRPEISDPFSRDDFTFNLNKQDAHPGVFPCTSGSRPTWGVPQFGLLIHETDTGRIMRWTSGGWVSLNAFPKVKVFSAHSLGLQLHGGPFTQAMGTFTPPAACSAVVQGYFVSEGYDSTNPENKFHAMYGRIYIDGTDATGGPTSPTGPYTGAGWGRQGNGTQSTPVTGYREGLSASSHSLSFVVPFAITATLHAVLLTVSYVE